MLPFFRRFGYNSNDKEEAIMDCRTAESLVNAYINRTLPVEQLEDFIKHVRSCPSCYEELETYYIVHFAIRHLDDEDGENMTFDMHKMLEQDLHNREHYVHRRKIRKVLHVFLRVIFLLLVLGLLIFAAMQLGYIQISI